MIRALLVICGLGALAIGAMQGYVLAREAVAPLGRQGEPTRAAVEAGRPLFERERVRRFLRCSALSVMWLVIAMYGLLLVATAGTAP